MKKFCLFLLIVISFAISFMPDALADSNGNSFVVTPEYPNNQIEPDNGYFYMSIGTGITQTLTVNAVNQSTNDIKLYIETADAFTSPAGEMVYLTNNTSDTMGYTDKTYMVSKVINIPADSLILKSGESKSINITVTAPAITGGEALGAVRFYTLSNGGINNNQNNNSPGMNVTIKTAQTIPIRIRVSQPTEVQTPYLDVGEVGFDKAQNEYYIDVKNNLAAINKLDKITYEITDSSKYSVFKKELDNVEMAPKTYIKLYLDWFDNTRAPGTYNISINYQYKGKSDNSIKELSLNTTQIEALPKATQASSAGNLSLILPELIIAIGAAIIVLIIVILIVNRKKNKKMQTHKNRYII